MNATLEFRRRYRATVHVSQQIRTMFGLTPEVLRSQLERYQLFGAVRETLDGYVVEATFKGKTGTYSLPEQVASVEIIG